MLKEKVNLFIFRRDFRIIDNKGLIELSKTSNNEIIPVFIFTPEQITTKNKYRSNNSVLFMLECLEELQKEIKKQNGRLLFFYGNNNDVINEISEVYNLEFIMYNKDYTPYAKKRDNEIEELCNSNNIKHKSICDYYLNKIGSIKTNENTTYTKFTPYLNKANKNLVDKPHNKKINFKNSNRKIKFQIELQYIKERFTKENINKLFIGGRNNALIKLKDSKTQTDYNSTRNDLFKQTTQLSAYIKFGCLSIREVYHYFIKHLGKNNDLIKQLYWRDFYMDVLNAYPHVLLRSLKSHYDDINWINNKEWTKKWKSGNTGFPIVDACMRQMNKEGYMPNRGRLIVSSFLIKVLLTDWKKGEKYFAKKLIDYDPASNNGGWQWSAGSGADSQQYNRIFNPWLQSSKHDPYCVYIKTYIPELMDVDTKDIHNWYLSCNNYKNINYPKPIVDYKKQKEITLERYSEIYK